MLVKQMVTESEAYIVTLLTTLKHIKGESYDKTSQNLYSVLSTYINDNVIERYKWFIWYVLDFLNSVDWNNALIQWKSIIFTIFSVSYGKEYTPIGLAILDSISRICFILPELNNLIVLQSLVSLRDGIYARLIST